MKLSELLQSIIDNPDDLSQLPNAVAKVQELEGQDEKYQERINKLQEINRNYLAQIPIPGNEPTDNEKDKPATLEDAQQHIINTITGGNK